MSQPANTHPLTSQPSPNLAVYAINQQPCSAEEYAAAACDPRRNIAIEACAGSGKTWILVSRILRALLDGVEPQSILAITFTKKAAGEMRTRLVEWLVAFSQEPDDEKLAHELRIRGIAQPDSALLARLRGLHAHLLQQPHTVQIRTFHGWFGALLQAAPYSVFEALGLPKPYELIEDDTLAIAQVWPLFYAQLQRDPALAADYQCLITDYSRHNAQEMLNNALGRRLEFSRADEYGAVERSLPTLQAAFPELAAYESITAILSPGTVAYTQLQQAATDMCADSSKTNKKLGESLLLGLAKSDLDECWNALFTKTGSLRAKLPTLASINIAASILREITDWQGYPRALAHQARMTRLLRALLEQYRLLKMQRAWVDMNDLELAAHRLLTNNELSAWMQERLDNQVRQVLIDEFQDTSPLQWQILSDWLSGYAGAGGGQAPLRVFLVGDPKQSIYRFRNAEPRVFIAAQEMVRDTLGGDLLSCDHTRRNAQAIIHTLNQLMDGSGMDGFRPHSSASAEAGQVLVSYQAAKAKDESKDELPTWRDSLTTPRKPETSHGRQAELDTVASWLQEKIQTEGVPAQDCMVLARKHIDLVALDEVLSARGIAAIRVEKQALPDYMEVQDLIALLDVLHSPTKNLSLAQVLKSPIAGFSDADLTQIARHVQTDKSSWWQALQDLSVGSRPDWASLAALLLKWQALLGQLPAYDVLFTIYAEGDILARYAQNSPSAKRERTLGNLRALLQAALDFQGGRFTSTWQFLRGLNDPHLQGNFKAPDMGASHAVRLLTIHGAKGLEAEHVALLNCQPSAPAHGSYGIYTDWPAESHYPIKFIFRTTAKETPQLVQALMDQEKGMQAREALNSMYVAITRARKSVLISATANNRAPADNWWSLLQQHVKPESYTDISSASILQTANTSIEPPLRLPQLPQLPELPPVEGKANAAPSEAATLESRRGQALHRLLEWQVDAENLNLQLLARLARDFQLSSADCTSLAQQAQQIQSGPAAWIWDAAQISWGASEVALTHQGQVLRLDRLVQAASSQDWWVIDYKSALKPEHDAALQAQMQQYCLAVQAWQGAAARVRGAWVAGDGRWAPMATE